MNPNKAHLAYITTTLCFKFEGLPSHRKKYHKLDVCTHLENPLVHYDHKHIETPPLQNGQDSSKLSAANWHTSFEILHFCLLLSFLWDLRNKKTVAELHKRILQKPNPRPKYLHFYVKQLGGGFFSKKPWPCCR